MCYAETDGKIDVDSGDLIDANTSNELCPSKRSTNEFKYYNDGFEHRSAIRV